MPDPTDDVLDLDHTHEVQPEPEEPEMAEQLTEPGNLQVAMTVLAQGAAANHNLAMGAATQLAADSQRMWSIAMTSPTVMAAHGMRVANESGAGRTRIEANTPAGSQIVGG